MLLWLTKFALRTGLLTGGILLVIWLTSFALGGTESIDWRRVAGVTFGIVALVSPVLSVFWVRSSRTNNAQSNGNYIDTLHYGGGGENPD